MATKKKETKKVAKKKSVNGSTKRALPKKKAVAAKVSTNGLDEGTIEKLPSVADGDLSQDVRVQVSDADFLKIMQLDMARKQLALDYGDAHLQLELMEQRVKELKERK